MDAEIMKMLQKYTLLSSGLEQRQTFEVAFDFDFVPKAKFSKPTSSSKATLADWRPTFFCPSSSRPRRAKH